jgi:hypothetical protein
LPSERGFTRAISFIFVLEIGIVWFRKIVNRLADASEYSTRTKILHGYGIESNEDI